MEENKNKIIINKETALESFNEFCEDWEIEPEFLDLNEEEKNDFNSHRDKIVKAIMKNRLIYHTETSSFEYTLSDKSKDIEKKTLTLKRPKGRNLRQSDRAKQGKDIEKTYMVLASLLGDDLNLIDALDMVDLKPLLAVSSLFLSS